MNFLAHDFATCNDRDRRAHSFRHAGSAREPGRLPEWFADDVFKRSLDTRERRGVGIQQRAVGRHQAHVGVAGFKDSAQARFLRPQLRRALSNLKLERLVESARYSLGCAALHRHLEIGPDARQQLARAERLDEVVVGAGVETFNACLLTGARGKQNHGHVAKIAVAA